MILQVLLISKRSPSTRGAVRDDSSRCPKIKWSWDRLRHDPHLRSKTHHEENGSFKMESIGKSFKKILLLLSHFASKWPKKMKFKKKNTSQPKNNIKQLYITKRHVFPNVFFGVTSLVLGSFHHHHMDRALTLEFNKAATTSWWPFMDPLASGIQH